MCVCLYVCLRVCLLVRLCGVCFRCVYELNVYKPMCLCMHLICKFVMGRSADRVALVEQMNSFFESLIFMLFCRAGKLT